MGRLGYLNWLFALDRSPKGGHASCHAEDPDNCKQCGAGRYMKTKEDEIPVPDMRRSREKDCKGLSDTEKDGRFERPKDFLKAIEESSLTAERKAQMRRVVESVTTKSGDFAKRFRCAPNGKPSNLDDWHWAMVRTPAFKEWFGDWEANAELYKEKLSDTIKTATGAVSIRESARPVRSIIAQRILEGNPSSVSKVVDGNGEPKICYHSTDADFERFDLDRFGTTDPGYYGVALYFSPHEQRQYGSRMIGVFLNCRKMVDFSDSDSMTKEQWDDYMAFQREHIRILQSSSGELITKSMKKEMVKVSRDFTERMERDGIDGFTANYGLEIGVYSPSQVMIVTDERKQQQD